MWAKLIETDVFAVQIAGELQKGEEQEDSARELTPRVPTSLQFSRR